MNESNHELNVALARRVTGISLETQIEQGLPEHITRGLGRTTFVGYNEYGDKISAEGILVAEQIRINQMTGPESEQSQQT